MKCGVAVVFMNATDVERVKAEDWSRGPAIPDHAIWDDSLALGDLVEPLGFDGIWSSEHMASPYGMCPNTLMHLAYWAGRTEEISLGTHVVVLPWHNPIQTAHEIAMLDVMMKGRPFTLGVGRGLSPKEFAAVGVPQEEARQRFKETIEILQVALSSERFSYEGEIFKIPETSIRPQPRDKHLMDRAVGAFMTAPSLEVVAKTGLGPIVVAGQSYEQVGKDVALFNQFREEAGLSGDVQPILYLWAYCIEKEGDTDQALAAMTQMEAAGAFHYGFAETTGPASVKGYEQYGELLGKRGAPVDPFGPHLVGTPEQIIEKAERMQKATGAKELITVFNFAGCIARDEAERSMRLFAQEVLPSIHALPTPAAQLTAAATA